MGQRAPVVEDDEVDIEGEERDEERERPKVEDGDERDKGSGTEMGRAGSPMWRTTGEVQRQS